MNVPDYGRYAPGPPSAEAIARRDQLAEALAVAPRDSGSKERQLAEERLVLHLLEVGLPLEDFSTPSGRAFVVKVSVSVPGPIKGRERDAQRWLAAQDGSARTNAHRLVERGGVFPADLFKPTWPLVHVKAV